MLPAENAERGLDTGLTGLHRVEKNLPAVGSRQIDGDTAGPDEHEPLGLVSRPKQDRALGQVHGLELRETLAAVGIERAGDVGQTGMHWLDPALRVAWEPPLSRTVTRMETGFARNSDPAGVCAMTGNRQHWPAYAAALPIATSGDLRNPRGQASHIARQVPLGDRKTCEDRTHEYPVACSFGRRHLHAPGDAGAQYRCRGGQPRSRHPALSVLPVDARRRILQFRDISRPVLAGADAIHHGRQPFLRHLRRSLSHRAGALAQAGGRDNDFRPG